MFAAYEEIWMSGNLDRYYTVLLFEKVTLLTNDRTRFPKIYIGMDASQQKA